MRAPGHRHHARGRRGRQRTGAVGRHGDSRDGDPREEATAVGGLAAAAYARQGVPGRRQRGIQRRHTPRGASGDREQAGEEVQAALRPRRARPDLGDARARDPRRRHRGLLRGARHAQHPDALLEDRRRRRYQPVGRVGRHVD